MKFWFSRRLGNLMLQQEADLGKLRSEASYFCWDACIEERAYCGILIELGSISNRDHASLY